MKTGHVLMQTAATHVPQAHEVQNVGSAWSIILSHARLTKLIKIAILILYLQAKITMDGPLIYYPNVGMYK